MNVAQFDSGSGVVHTRVGRVSISSWVARLFAQQPVATTTRCNLVTWDVADLRGKSAKIQVVDRVKGGWGNIGVDHIVFTDEIEGAVKQFAADLFSDEYREVINKIAKRHQLDATRLAKWTAHLLAAREDEQELLHLWSLVATKQGVTGNGEISHEVVEKFQRMSSLVEAKVPANTTEIIDFTQSTDTEMRTDGVTFGLRPQRMGDIVLSTDPRQPLAGIATYGAVRRHADFRELKLAGGAAKDSGRLGKWDRAGKTLRTPSFEIRHGQIAFLVRGKGVSYAVVDSHRMINGPLHGSILKEFNVSGDQPQWVVHNLARYRGHGVHLEFSAVGGDDLEILRVVDSAQRQPEFAGAPHPLVNHSISSRQVSSLAKGYQRHVARGVESLTRGEITTRRRVTRQLDCQARRSLRWRDTWRARTGGPGVSREGGRVDGSDQA